MKNMKLNLIIMIALTAIFVASCSSLINFGEENTLKNSQNYVDGKFRNNTTTTVSSDNSFWKSMREMMFGDQIRFPEFELPYQKVKTDDLDSENNSLEVTWLGHSSSIIKLDNQVVITDPVFSKRVSPIPFMGPKRFNKELPLDGLNIEKVDAIVISHNHYDHLDKKAIKTLNDKTTKFLVPLGVGKLLMKWDVPKEKIVELDWWQSYKLESGLEFTATPARHFSGRGIFDSAKTLWASWVIIGSKERVFFSGDSGYFEGFKEIGEKFGPFDLAMIENGQYNEGWSDIHMFPEESVQAFIDVKGKVLLPIHWGAYNLSIHDWHEPVERLVNESIKRGVTFTTPKIGETVILNEYLPQSKWWYDVVKKQSNFADLELNLQPN
jgi:L-ascorbate metabolism protein UlaG (beta-lactamase superfamily)